jgi:transposase
MDGAHALLRGRHARYRQQRRALRTVARGRNNWTFCGSDAGGHRAAILYSLVATCKAHGIDPWAYLRDVFDRIPTHPNRRRAELLPRQWKAA